jgi:hypothetical protein
MKSREKATRGPAKGTCKDSESTKGMVYRLVVVELKTIAHPSQFTMNKLFLDYL